MMANAEGNCEGQVTREGEVFILGSPWLSFHREMDEGEERK